MYDYTVWIVFYYLFALSENDEIEMINQWNIKSKAVHTRITQKKEVNQYLKRHSATIWNVTTILTRDVYT